LVLPLAASLALPNSALDSSEVAETLLPTPNSALALVTRLRAALALLNSVDGVSRAAVALLLVQSALALARGSGEA